MSEDSVERTVKDRLLYLSYSKWGYRIFIIFHKINDWKTRRFIERIENAN